MYDFQLCIFKPVFMQVPNGSFTPIIDDGEDIPDLPGKGLAYSPTFFFPFPQRDGVKNVV